MSEKGDETPMKIGLHSGYAFTCEDESYTATNKISGDVIHTFVSIDGRKKYVVPGGSIEFWQSRLIDEELEELTMYGEDEEDDDCVDPAFV